MPFEKTIDWDAFWREAPERDRRKAAPSGEHAPGLLSSFFEATGVPGSFADVGCGPGSVVFELATRYPEMTIVGYDAAESVLEMNRELIRSTDCSSDSDHDVDFSRSSSPYANVRFERTVLPAFDPGREFDVVFAYCTLCYVEESRRALRNLYDAVAPGGYLVLGYVSERRRRHLEERFGDSAAGSSIRRFDSGDRFQLVLDGKSLLSYRRIHDALGTWPRSIWEIADKPQDRWAWDHVPTVWIPK